MDEMVVKSIDESDELQLCDGESARCWKHWIVISELMKRKQGKVEIASKGLSCKSMQELRRQRMTEYSGERHIFLQLRAKAQIVAWYRVVPQLKRSSK